jgi:hypothetical protein
MNSERDAIAAYVIEIDFGWPLAATTNDQQGSDADGQIQHTWKTHHQVIDPITGKFASGNNSGCESTYDGGRVWVEFGGSACDFCD